MVNFLKIEQPEIKRIYKLNETCLKLVGAS